MTDAGPTPKYRKQEQEPATTEVVEVAPGVIRTQLPIRMPGLGHVNCYLLEDSQGVALIDPGLPGPKPWKDLVDRLQRAGVPLKRVHTVIVTHSHPDHFGGAARLRKETGARIVTHRAFGSRWDPAPSDDADLEPVKKMTPPWKNSTPWGGQPARPPVVRRLGYRWMQYRHGFFPRPTQRLEDAEPIELAGREFVAVHTPGHTADHLCLFDPAMGTFISGDHVLPTITPHIGALDSHEDSLASFFASLDKVAALDERTSVVLPAHGHPFADLRARAESIKEHHAERLEVLAKASRDLGRAAPVSELSTHLFKPRSLGPMADSETFAHLEHLPAARPGRTPMGRRPAPVPRQLITVAGSQFDPQTTTTTRSPASGWYAPVLQAA